MLDGTIGGVKQEPSENLSTSMLRSAERSSINASRRNHRVSDIAFSADISRTITLLNIKVDTHIYRMVSDNLKRLFSDLKMSMS